MIARDLKLWQMMLAQSFEPRQWFDDDDSPSKPTIPKGGRIMWVYRKSGDVWEVGYYSPDKAWVAESEHKTPAAAAERVNWLNGGNRVNPDVSDAARHGFTGT